MDSSSAQGRWLETAVPELASPHSTAKDRGRSAKHAVDDPLSASELDVAVRAFEHLSQKSVRTVA